MKIKTIITVALVVAILTASVFVVILKDNGTGGGGGDVTVDTTKTQLYVRYFAGGLGTEWIDEVCSNFERDFANVSFQEGKRGVQIVPKFEKTQIAADAIQNNNSDVFLMEHTSYSDAVNKGFLLPITDIVTDYAVTGYNGEGTFDTAKLIKETDKTIEQKLSDSGRSFYKITEDYYGTPFYTALHQMIYNAELFETYNLYYNAESDGWLDEFDNMDKQYASILADEDDNFVASKNAEKSKGPDGVSGTYDDGLPATYGQLWVLMERMLKKANITPFIFQEGYADHYFCAWDKDIWANAEGYEQTMLNLTWNGTATNLLDEDGNIYSQEITPDNAYLLQKQEGRLKSLEFYNMLLSNPKYVYEKSFDGSFSHLNAQQFFVKAGQEGNYIDMKYGMLMDGSWWNAEAKPAFLNNSFLTRNFGVMPIPKTDSSKVGSTNADGTHITQVDCYDSNIYIKSNIAEERKTVAKLFVSYISNDQSLNTFTKYTQAFRAMSYTLSEDTLNHMTAYGKSAYQAYRDTAVVSWLPTTPVTQNNLSVVAYRMYGVTNGVSDGSSALAALKRVDVNLNPIFASPKDYFVRTARYYEQNWNTIVEFGN